MKYSFAPIGLVLMALLVSCNKIDTTHRKGASDLVFVGDYSLGLEGPAVDKDGNLFFVNPLQSGTIGKVSSDGRFELFIDSLPNGSIANGIRFDKTGKMYLADYINHNVLRIDPLNKSVEIFANNDAMNQPNDLAITSDGTLYASDPDWENKSGQLWKIDKNGTTFLLESNMGTTNGIEVAPGDSILYVNESVQRKIWSYKLLPDGSISDKKLLIEFSDHGLDGMRCDNEGNLFVTRYGKGTIAIISPDGKPIDEIKLKGKKPTNIAFGSPDGKTCYVTCQDRGYIEQFRTNYPGRSWSNLSEFSVQ